MPAAPIITANTLFYGDNLPILREYIADASVDLVYLDPPFNSNRNYNVLFKDERGSESEAQITAFEDTWHWNQAAEQTYQELITDVGGEVGTMIGALHSFIGPSQMLAYLVMMAARLVELHRVLKPTGSLYLHCDPTASHYLKVILDTIFGPEQFRNEIVWKRTSGRKSGNQYGRVHDIVLLYTKSQISVWNAPKTPQTAENARGHDLIRDGSNVYRLSDLSGAGQGPARRFGDKIIAPPPGRHWMFDQDGVDRLFAEGRIVFNRNGVPRLKKTIEELPGVDITDTWLDIEPINSAAAERLGYPTQKPLALLDRIIAASSNEGDLVLDPFCGCGTTIAAAQKLGRRWVGIDITHLSIALQKYRLEQSFPGISFKVVGEPEDLGAARQLANDDRYQFQWWALSLVRARPLGGEAGSKQGKKGSDKGIDGVITFLDDASGKPKRALIQVKSGKVNSGLIRDLRGTIEREQAQLGVFLTLEEPTRDMLIEAAAAGVYRPPSWGRDYPKLQILTIAELLRGAEIKMPPAHGTFKQAQRVQLPEAEQGQFDL